MDNKNVALQISILSVLLFAWPVELCMRMRLAFWTWVQGFGDAVRGFDLKLHVVGVSGNID